MGAAPDKADDWIEGRAYIEQRAGRWHVRLENNDGTVAELAESFDTYKEADDALEAYLDEIEAEHGRVH